MSPDPIAHTPRWYRYFAEHAWAAHLLAASTMLLFASNHVVGRAIREDIPPIGLIFWRCSVAVLLLAPFFIPQIRTQLALILRHWKLMLLLGITQAVTGQVLLYEGLHTTTAINAGLLNATLPAMTIFIAWLLLRDPVRKRQIVGLVIALAGVMAIVARGELAVLINLRLVIGDLWVQIAFFSWAIYVVLVRRVPRGLSPAVVFIAMTAASIAVLAPLYAWETFLAGRPVPLNGVTIFAVLYMAIFAQILALILWNASIAHIGAGAAGMYTNLVPVYTALMAVTLLGELFQVHHLAGTALVFLGVFLATKMSAARTNVPDQP